MQSVTQTILVIGGGAGGLGLVTRLARKYRKNKAVEVILVDYRPTHIWKPLLHEVATGSLDSNHDEISYLSLARKFRFRFVLAAMTGVNPDKYSVTVKPLIGRLEDDEPEQSREIAYSQLVLCIGSESNDFATPGVAENAIFLDSRQQAEQFHRRFIAHLHRFNQRHEEDSVLNVVIIGGGATGVELSADLHNVTAQLEDYGFEKFKPGHLSITLLEAGPRLLAQLPERISASVAAELEKIGVEVRLNARVTRISKNEVLVGEGEPIESQLSVWAAGIRAPDVLEKSGLVVDRIGRVIVNRSLNVNEHPEIFVLGDCCHCPLRSAEAGETVPPRAQSAHQMSATVYKNLLRQMTHETLVEFEYHDFGSLVNLSKNSTIGNLMGNLMRGSLFIEGWIARLMYKMLYRMHQVGVHGYFATGLIMLGDKIHRVTRSHLKLH